MRALEKRMAERKGTSPKYTGKMRMVIPLSDLRRSLGNPNPPVQNSEKMRAVIPLSGLRKSLGD